MEEYDERYLDLIQNKYKIVEVIAKHLGNGLIDKMDFSNFTGFIAEATLETMWKRGNIPRAGNDVFITIEDDEYWVYYANNKSNSLVKGYVTIETYNHIFEEYSKVRLQVEALNQRRRDERRRHLGRSGGPLSPSSMGSFQQSCKLPHTSKRLDSMMYGLMAEKLEKKPTKKENFSRRLFKRIFRTSSKRNDRRKIKT